MLIKQSLASFPLFGCTLQSIELADVLLLLLYSCLAVLCFTGYEAPVEKRLRRTHTRDSHLAALTSDGSAYDCSLSLVTRNERVVKQGSEDKQGSEELASPFTFTPQWPRFRGPRMLGSAHGDEPHVTGVSWSPQLAPSIVAQLQGYGITHAARHRVATLKNELIYHYGNGDSDRSSDRSRGAGPASPVLTASGRSSPDHVSYGCFHGSETSALGAYVPGTGPPPEKRRAASFSPAPPVTSIGQNKLLASLHQARLTRLADQS